MSRQSQVRFHPSPLRAVSTMAAQTIAGIIKSGAPNFVKTLIADAAAQQN